MLLTPISLPLLYLFKENSDYLAIICSPQVIFSFLPPFPDLFLKAGVGSVQHNCQKGSLRSF